MKLNSNKTSNKNFKIGGVCCQIFVCVFWHRFVCLKILNHLLRIYIYLQEGFAQPDQENDADNFHDPAVNNGDGSALIGGDDETF